MGDNYPPHHAHVTNAYLAIVHIDWPARSSAPESERAYMGILQRAISGRPVQPRTLQELKDALVAEWRLISQNRIHTLITSMRRRCRAVIDVRRY